MSIPRLSLNRPVATWMLYVGIAFLGVLSFLRLPVDLLPDIAYPRLVVYTSYPNVGPAEVERFITELIEPQVSRVPGVERLESVSREGTSLIFIRFAWGTDMDFAALNVREAIDRIRDRLPELAERPVVLRQDPRSEPVMALSVSADYDLWALQQLSDNLFRRRLEQIDGVAQAAITGGLDREIHVDVDEDRLRSYGVTIQQLQQALDNANQEGGGGWVRRGQFRYPLRTLGELQSVDEIGRIALTQVQPSDSTPGGRVLVSDVATVSDGFQERESAARYNGKQSIGLLIFKESGANTVQVAREVDTVLDQLRGDYPDVTIDIAMSQAGFITSSIANLVQNLIVGGMLAFLVLFLFLRDARYPIAIALSIPISVIATFALLDAAHVSLNIMSLGGLALGTGMLVDNSIVVLENIFRHREKGVATAIAAAIGAEEVQRAITASTFTTIAVFGPIIYVHGVAGQLFAALSFAVAFSLLASLAVAVTLLPVLAGRSATGATHRIGRVFGRIFGPMLDSFDRAFGRFTRWYERTLESALHHRVRVVLVSAILLAITLPLALSLPRSVLPEVDQGEFRVRMELARGTPLETTIASAMRLDSIMRADPDVDAVFMRAGKQTAIAGVEEQESGLNTAVMEVRTHDGVGAHEVVERLRPKLLLDGATIAVETGQATAVGKLLGAAQSDLAVRIRGDDMDAALAYAEQVRAHIEHVPEVTNVRVGTELGSPEYLIEVNRDRAAAFGLAASDVAQVVDDNMLGRKATQPFVSFDRKIDMVVRLPESSRRSIETIDRLFVKGVPLRDLVNIRETMGPIEIQRVDQSRVVPVQADVATGDVDGAVHAVRTAIAGLPVPRGLRVDIGGENEEMRRSFRDLTLAFSLAIVLVYMILAAEFESFMHPFTIMLCVPLSLIGAVFGLWLHGSGLNTVSLIGIVILAGIVDNDAVVKIDFINQMRREGMNTRDAIMAAGHARLRPILMTSVTTMLGVLPMMLGFGTGGGLQAPLAVAVFWGLLASTALTLIVIPVIYEMVDDARVWISHRAGRTASAPGDVTVHDPSAGTSGMPEPASGD
jgi:hydrophobic/amphiphilic exporter-1 (mainly G- bacteria), HAE1 family